ncbi:aminotransferase class I/II-fold pyridoxal phosphate-dependent enzyme [Thalassobacillus devorans]|uniref:aminotransferase class I/II-fold pyridoxal phosphate-dependent enzyme n=1 Tax=Thalassobacillus devorans TaxID=279813 RepID=UPI00048E39C3|nr:aminotransferase class I/II-fold pyridoxal phosphate-dependent enzyme [Thalassobacillus devorans]
MALDQTETPLYDRLYFQKNKSYDSFHVPGHKNGRIFSEKGYEDFRSILSMDFTEITGMDDLHDPHGVIQQAQILASDYFNSDFSYFLVNGSTGGNLAMILAVCKTGDQVLVQRNCHKSILHGLELAGAQPVFLTPAYEENTKRYSKMEVDLVEKALARFPNAKGLILTYPDYFGRTYEIEKIIRTAHAHDVPVLVDEAHGVHFHLGSPFPTPSLTAGADVVVQSAHKMAPAMTMASFIHGRKGRINLEKLRYFLQVVQSSSPSYPLMASLDLARHFLANTTKENVEKALDHTENIRRVLVEGDGWTLLPASHKDDPLKIVLHADKGWTGFQLAGLLEQEDIYPELADNNQVLLITGLGEYADLSNLNKCIANINEQLKTTSKHATIKDRVSFPTSTQELLYSYEEMKTKQTTFSEWSKAVGKVAAQPVVPYPPGIPLLVKGEKITIQHVELIRLLLEQGARFHNEQIETGVFTFQ